MDPAVNGLIKLCGTNDWVWFGLWLGLSCCDVALGARLRKDIYEAVRAGPGWNETALLFTWDDPGGFFDHVPPPMRAPAPDDQPACFCFEGAQCHGDDPRGYEPFTRLGSRLPVLLIFVASNHVAK